MGKYGVGWWVVAGLVIVAIAALGWGYRAWRRAAAQREAAHLRASVEAAARIEAQQRASEAAKVAAIRRAERETAAQEAAARAVIARAKAAREAADHDAAARHAAARHSAEASARALAEHEAAARVARAQADRQMAQEAQRLEAHRQATAQRLAESAPPPAPPPPAPPPSPPPPAKPPADTLVLIADDSKVVRVKTGRLLAQHHYRVAYATDGRDAAEQLRTDPPDVVITDVEMPGMDGFELARHVRQNPLTAHIPIIMITAADDKHRDDAQRAGVTVLLGKPYPEDELIGHIRLAMDRARSQRAG